MLRCCSFSCFLSAPQHERHTTPRFYRTHLWNSQSGARLRFPVKHRALPPRTAPWHATKSAEAVGEGELGLFRNSSARRGRQERNWQWCNGTNNAPEIDTIFPLRIKEHSPTNPPLRTAVATRCGAHSLRCALARHGAKLGPGRAEGWRTKDDITEKGVSVNTSLRAYLFFLRRQSSCHGPR